MLIDDAKPRIIAPRRRAMRNTTEDRPDVLMQRAALERAFARLLGGRAASGALADLIAPRDDERVH